MVSKRNFEKRSLDGLQIKAQAYSCKIGLTQFGNPAAFQLFKTAAIFVYVAIYVVPSLSGASVHFSVWPLPHPLPIRVREKAL